MSCGSMQKQRSSARQRLAEVARGNLARRSANPSTGPLDLAWFDRVEGYGPSRPIEPFGTLALAAARADATTAEAQVRLARAQRVPDVTLSASARRLEATNDVAAVFGLSIPFPVFNNGTAAIAQARAQSDQAQALRRVAELDTAKDIANAQAEVANAATTARNASGPALASATEAARIARIGYREGKFGQLDLLDAERTLSETRTAAIDALATYHDAKARLERLIAAAPRVCETNDDQDDHAGLVARDAGHPPCRMRREQGQWRGRRKAWSQEGSCRRPARPPKAPKDVVTLSAQQIADAGIEVDAADGRRYRRRDRAVRR